MLKVNVIIPTYNRATLVCDAIESVLAQTYQDIGIIIVDDGSTDDTVTRLKKYAAEPRIRIIQGDHRGVKLLEGEAYFESGSDVVAALPMPPELIAWIGAFVDAYHVERVFLKRKRDSKDNRKERGGRGGGGA